MKKSIFAILAALLIIPLVLCACGKSQDKPDTPATKEAQTENVTSEEPEEPEEDADQEEADNEEELVKVTADLMDRVKTLQYVDAAALEVDDSITYTDENGYTYHPVADERFPSIGDINIYLTDTFTIDGAKQNFPYLVDPSLSVPPVYILVQEEDYPTGIYMLEAAKGFPVYNIDTPVEILSAGDDWFTAQFGYDDFGRMMTLQVEIVKENDVWKINAMQSIEP